MCNASLRPKKASPSCIFNHGELSFASTAWNGKNSSVSGVNDAVARARIQSSKMKCTSAQVTLVKCLKPQSLKTYTRQIPNTSIYHTIVGFSSSMIIISSNNIKSNLIVDVKKTLNFKVLKFSDTKFKHRITIFASSDSGAQALSRLYLLVTKEDQRPDSGNILKNQILLHYHFLTTKKVKYKIICFVCVPKKIFLRMFIFFKDCF